MITSSLGVKSMSVKGLSQAERRTSHQGRLPWSFWTPLLPSAWCARQDVRVISIAHLSLEAFSDMDIKCGFFLIAFG